LDFNLHHHDHLYLRPPWSITSECQPGWRLLLILAGSIHAGKELGGVIAKKLATYVVEKGKPLLTLVKCDGPCQPRLKPR